MLRRYAALITDQGMDAAIPLIDDPDGMREVQAEAEISYRKKLHYIYLKYGKKIFDSIFLDGRNVYLNPNGKIVGVDFGGWNSSPFDKEVDALIAAKQQEIIDWGMEIGAADPGSYFGYDMRKKFAGTIEMEPIFAIDEDDFKILRSRMSPWHSAFYILDGMINGKTDLGRFNETKKKTTIVLNQMVDGKFDLKKMKKLRRVFFDKISGSGEEDDDII